jgi:hypothetical protein
MVLGRVPGDPGEGDRMVEHEMGEETTDLVAPRGTVRDGEAVSLQVLPKELGRQRMDLGPVLGASNGTIHGTADRIGGFRSSELHTASRSFGPI